MFNVKNTVYKAFCFVGAAVIFLCLCFVLFGNAFTELHGSVTLISISLLLLTILCVKCTAAVCACFKERKPDLKKDSFITGFALICILGIAVRGVTFIIVDFNFASAEAFYLYASSAVNTTLLYMLAMKLWKHACGVVAAVIYALLGNFELLTALNYESFNINLLSCICAQSFALLSLLLLFYSVSTSKHNASIIFCAASALLSGAAAALEFIYFILFFCAAAYYIAAHTKLRKKNSWKTRPHVINKAAFIGIYVIAFAAAFTASAVIFYTVFEANAFEQMSAYSLPKGESFFEIMLATDRAADKALTVLTFDKNYFLNYIQLTVSAVLMLCASAGAFSAGKKNDYKTIVLVLYVAAAVAFAILVGGNTYMMLTVLPFIVLLSVYGMLSLSEFSAVLSEHYRSYAKQNSTAKSAAETADINGASYVTEVDEYPQPYIAVGGSVAKDDDREHLLNSLLEGNDIK